MLAMRAGPLTAPPSGFAPLDSGPFTLIFRAVMQAGSRPLSGRQGHRCSSARVGLRGQEGSRRAIRPVLADANGWLLLETRPPVQLRLLSVPCRRARQHPYCAIADCERLELWSFCWLIFRNRKAARDATSPPAASDIYAHPH